MLTQLNIQGLAIIDSLSIEFSPGFNVITGETGAGKSILIKALGLLLGTKASAETVRRGRDTASVSGVFDVPLDHPCGAVLTKYGIDYETGAASFTLLVRRTVTSKGRSFAWINDVPVTVAVLRDLAMALIDVFGQHENLRLLDAVQHMYYLDQFLRDKLLSRRYSEQFAAVQAQMHALSGMVEAFRARRRDADYLAFRCAELRDFAPTSDDFLKIQDLCRRSGQIMTIVKGLEDAQACVDQGAGGETLGRPLWEAGKILARIATITPALNELAEYTSALAAQIDDLSYQIGKAAAGMELSDDDVEVAQTRLAGYQELFRKLAVPDIAGLLVETERLSAELGFLESAASEVKSRLAALGESTAALATMAAKLSKARRQAKASVKRRIEAELHELAMPGAAMDVELSPVQRQLPVLDLAVFGDSTQQRWLAIAATLSGLSEHGAERAQFMLAANPGEVMLPLHKIASGGEISRVTLALKKALAVGADTCILVFDEIDSGISGRVADVVGRKMQELSQDFQVICISHLAQVAAYASAHFLVHKCRRDERTESTITRLGARESEEELARLLSGQEVTQSSLANARALRKKARTKVLTA